MTFTPTTKLGPDQINELIVDESVATDAELRAELIRQATATDAHGEIVRDHPDLASHDGVAATLHCRI